MEFETEDEVNITIDRDFVQKQHNCDRDLVVKKIASFCCKNSFNYDITKDTIRMIQ